MRKFRLEDMKGGWFVGDFQPVVLQLPSCEVACKHYPPGAREDRHVHRVATEITVIVRGQARMNGSTCSAGDIIRLEPGEAADFEVLQETTTLVVKTPSLVGDKYPA